ERMVRQHEGDCGRAGGQPALEAAADDARQSHGDRLAQHGGARLDAAHAPAENAEPVDHGCVAVERLRAYKVVAAFVEFFGEGLASLSLSGRATLANVAPEYGATMMGIAPDLDGAAAVKGIPKIAL